MKRILSVLLSVIVMCSMTIGLDTTAFAADTGQLADGATYRYDDATGELVLSGEVEVTTLKGLGFRDVKHLVIENGITGLGDHLFENKTALESVVMADSVQKIGDSVFEGCTRLKTVELSNGLTEISYAAFDTCKSLESIVVPNSVTTIDDCAFSGCEALKNIKWSNHLTAIQSSAFSHCYSLESIALPDSVTEIGSDVFSSCKALQTVTLSKHLSVISRKAFSFCENLLHVTLPEGVTTVEPMAFYDCYKLNQVTLPKTLVSIGEEAFENCDLSSVVIPGNHVDVEFCAFAAENSSDPLILCNSTTQVDRGRAVFFTDKIVPVSHFKDLYSSKYDSEDGVLYSFVPNKSGTYYAGMSNSYRNYILDGDFNLLKSQKIDPVTTLMNDHTGGYAFYLEKGRTYYFPYGGPSIQEYEIIKDYQYVDTGKQFIKGDYNYNCLKIVYPDNSYRYVNYCGNDVTDLSKTITSQYAGKKTSFKLNSPVTFDEFEVLNGKYIDQNFITAIQTKNAKTLNKYPVTYRLHLSDGKVYDIKNYNIICLYNTSNYGRYRSEWRCETADGRDFDVVFFYDEDEPDQLKIQVDNGNLKSGPSVTVQVGNAHTHAFKQTVTPATTGKSGKTVKTCSICGASSTATIAKVSSVRISATNYTYNGKTQKPTVTVKNSNGKALKNGTDYTVSYSSGCKNVGRYTVKVTLKGNYSGTKSLTYNINPKGTSVSKVTAAKKGFKVTWKKQATQTTGYEVQYSTDKNFKKGNKTVNITKNSITSKSVSKLSAKKKYYVRVRTYKTVKVNGKNVKLYSGWSKVKSVTTKK